MKLAVLCIKFMLLGSEPMQRQNNGRLRTLSCYKFKLLDEDFEVLEQEIKMWDGKQNIFPS